MPRHAAPVKKPSLKPFIWSGVGVIALVLVILFVCNGGVQLVSTGLSSLFSASSEPESSADASSPADSQPESDASEESAESAESDPTPPSLPAPGALRGVWLRPGVDYDKGGKQDEDEVKKELSTLFGQLQSWNMDTVLLPLVEDGKALFATTATEPYAAWDVTAS
ncbi:MAG: hypothetical protein IJZ13_08850, partial [Clostridia bacterium]|nr:hypothetical protein [Clostridia bacterium]